MICPLEIMSGALLKIRQVAQIVISQVLLIGKRAKIFHRLCSVLSGDDDKPSITDSAVECKSGRRTMLRSRETVSRQPHELKTVGSTPTSATETLSFFRFAVPVGFWEEGHKTETTGGTR